MTTLRKFSQRQATGKLSKHSGMQSALSKVPGLQGRVPNETFFGEQTPWHDPETVEEHEVVEPVPAKVKKDASRLPDTFLRAAIADSRKNKDGSPHKGDMKRIMGSNGYSHIDGYHDYADPRGWERS